MRHLLHDPHFPDIVGEWAVEDIGPVPGAAVPANDNIVGEVMELADPFLLMIAKLDVAATRLW